MNSRVPALPRPTRTRAALLAALCVVAAAAIALVLVLAGGSHPRALAPRTPVARVHARAPHHGVLVAEAPDPLAAQSFPDPAGAATHKPAAAPAVVAASVGAPSLATVEQQLAAERKLERSLTSHSVASLVNPVTGAFTPRNAVPMRINQVIAGGNAIADFPYVYGGGHGSFIARAYDCSGSVSYALAAAGLIGAPETSGQLEHWGVAGPGKYLTVFANAGHTFMVVDGVWFDTAGRAGPYSTRWLTSRPSLVGYAIRHYPGL
jgi:cell wall-associated NlpC family hydrolase